MKNKILLSVFLSLISFFINAQNPITTLEHAGNTTVFYGQNSLVDAYNASANGDDIYLSTGYFTAPSTIAKGIKIIGAGHFPDSLNVAKRTFILSELNINAGADSLRLEGMYINGGINYGRENSINYVKVIRCRFERVLSYSATVNASKNNCSFEECFIGGDMYFSGNENNILISKCVINGGIFDIKNAFINNNIMLRSGYSLFYRVNSCTVNNNIILYDGGNGLMEQCTGNVFNNNLFVRNEELGINSSSHNYIGISQNNIFINQTGNAIDYNHDYHLKSPAAYVGTDGTQIGIYGGTIPFKDKGLPSNPQIITKNVGTQTDANGNLQISFSVKAQDN